MRGAWLLSFAVVGGCDLVFPLDPIDAGAGSNEPAIDAFEFRDAPKPIDMSQPTVDSVMAGSVPFANETVVTFLVMVSGNNGQVAFLGLADDTGRDASLAFNPTSQSTVLQSSTPFQAVWTPPARFAHVVVKATASYDGTLTPNNNVPDGVEVFQHFGHITEPLTGMVFGSKILAMKIDVGTPAGKLANVGVTVSSASRGALALYDALGPAGAPKNLIFSFGPFSLPSSLAIKEVALPVPPDVSGPLWIAVLSEGQTNIAASGTSTSTDAAPALLASVGKFSDGFPGTFPSAGTVVEPDHRNWAMYITVKP